jgi:hypothetical protein
MNGEGCGPNEFRTLEDRAAAQVARGASPIIEHLNGVRLIIARPRPGLALDPSQIVYLRSPVGPGTPKPVEMGAGASESRGEFGAGDDRSDGDLDSRARAISTSFYAAFATIAAAGRETAQDAATVQPEAGASDRLRSAQGAARRFLRRLAGMLPAKCLRHPTRSSPYQRPPSAPGSRAQQVHPSSRPFISTTGPTVASEGNESMGLVERDA